MTLNPCPQKAFPQVNCPFLGYCDRFWRRPTQRPIGTTGKEGQAGCRDLMWAPVSSRIVFSTPLMWPHDQTRIWNHFWVRQAVSSVIAILTFLEHSKSVMISYGNIFKPRSNSGHPGGYPAWHPTKSNKQSGPKGICSYWAEYPEVVLIPLYLFSQQIVGHLPALLISAHPRQST